MSSYSEKINKLFFFWLLTSLGLIFSMVIIGGLTRLTDSGLSITEWELFKGILPPLNQTQWNEYFSYYKQIPQYKLLNNNMTIDQFKIIFYWEYFHRILGRVIGLFFLLPLIFFTLTKKSIRDIYKDKFICFIFNNSSRINRMVHGTKWFDYQYISQSLSTVITLNTSIYNIFNHFLDDT